MSFTRPDNAAATTTILVDAGIAEQILRGVVLNHWWIEPMKFTMWVLRTEAECCAPERRVQACYRIVVEYSYCGRDGLQHVINSEIGDSSRYASGMIILTDAQTRIIADIAIG
jgi:hypothetical protein